MRVPPTLRGKKVWIPLRSISELTPPPCAPRSSEQGGGLARFGRRRPAGLRAGPGGQAVLGMACPGLAQASKRLDFPKDFQGFETLKPKIFPARFARRKCFIFLRFFRLFGPQNPKKFPARFARRKPAFS